MARQVSGLRLINGDAVNDLVDLKSFTATTGLTALAGGGATGATQLQPGLNNVTVVATNDDSVILPVAKAGTLVLVVNSDSTQNIKVHAVGSDTINGTAGATGVAQSAGITALYTCPTDTKWFRLLSA